MSAPCARHAHDAADEAFLVLAGSMRIELRDGVAHLAAGDLYVVPKGTEHRPCAGRPLDTRPHGM